MTLACSATAQAEATINEFPAPGPGGVWGITAGPDGALWFTETGGRIGRLTTEGSFTNEYQVVGPSNITAGPDGALWFTRSENRIGRMSVAGVVTNEYEIPTLNAGVSSITAGPDGALWFTEGNNDKIGRITTAGSITEYESPAFNPGSITSGPDGALWFVAGGAKIWRITTSGVFTGYTAPQLEKLCCITAGSDGALWFVWDLKGTNRIGRIITAGVITNEYPAPRSTNVNDIVAGPDGALWFPEAVGWIGRITTGGAITETPVPSGNSPLKITAGPDNNLWFTEPRANQVGRLNLVAQPPPAVTSVSPTEDTGAGGTEVTITGTNFATVTAVKFGGNAARSFKVNSVRSITAVTPPGTGTVDITVTTPGGTSATGPADRFTYVPVPPPPAVTSLNPTTGPVKGGTSVTITGTNFSEVTAVAFGSASATSFKVSSATSITAVTPPGTGTVDVTVTSVNGRSAINPGDVFTYIGKAHYYVDGRLAGSEPVAFISWGTLALKTVSGGSAEVTCRTVTAGTIDNPAGEGVGLSSTKVFASYRCESNSCPADRLSVVAESLPWPSQLAEPVAAVFRSAIEGLRINIRCRPEGKEETEERFIGSLAPSFKRGSSAAHPSFLEFDAGAGKLEREGSKGTVLGTLEGELKMLGYQEQELISIKSP